MGDHFDLGEAALPEILTALVFYGDYVGSGLEYPAHDYKGRTCSSIEEERKFNPRLTKSKKEFVDLMNNLGLAVPKLLHIAVPANSNCGLDYEPSAKV